MFLCMHVDDRRQVAHLSWVRITAFLLVQELNVALQDPKLKDRLNFDASMLREEDDEGIYAGEMMDEIRADITWGDTDSQWKEGLILSVGDRIEVEDVENDLERELAFYNQALGAAFTAISKFEEDGVKWRRPDDYLAEMVKGDAHMAKVKEQLVHEQTVIEDAEQRRKERENRKYSKQVAAERRKERSQQKKQAIDSVTNLRKTRAKSNFEGDLNLDDIGIGEKKQKGQRLGDRFSAQKKSAKRQKRDSKYGFGGPKRRQKQNDAYSAAGGDGPKVNRGKSGPKQRPGKSRRQKMRSS